jgi:phosphoglucosamine mutase
VKKRFFGTDGIRGVANEKLTPEFAFKLGVATGRYILSQGLERRLVVGRDTRRSGPMLGAAFGAGLCAVGISVTSLSVVPTGCISYIARTKPYGMGAVISASHNPAPDNGIKLITNQGTKVPDEAELWIESQLDEPMTERPKGSDVGELLVSRQDVEDYIDYLAGLVPERLDGLVIAIDGAHGAAYQLGPEVFRRLGADVLATGCHPDGMNINEEGGATKPSTIQALTQDHRADLGVAFDGDADRAVFADSEGQLINGDRMMAIWCSYWQEQGKLTPPAVVGTVMSNSGFERYMAALGVELIRADVGDKYVSAELRKIGGRIGGEQSGHIVFPEYGPTGDGLITALALARILKLTGTNASNWTNRFQNWPQLLVNVEVGSKDGWEQALAGPLQSAIERLGDQGRVNIRPSGTQPMIRVMVESTDENLRDQVADNLVASLLESQGGKIYSRVDLTHALGD